MKKYLKRLLLGALAGASIYGTVRYTPPVTRYLLCQYKDDQIQEYVEQNLESIIKNQEEKLGIHFPKRPRIEYLLPPQWRLNGADGILGLYKPEENTIYLNSGLLTHLVPDFGDIVALFFSNGRMDDAISTVNHELGHFYCDSLTEAAGFGDWPLFEKGMDSGEIMGMRLVAEGIAEYIKKKAMGETEDNFKDSEWPQDPDYFYGNGLGNIYLIYGGGYHLVKPVIDQYGKQGMLYLMIFHPLEKDLTNLPEYQKKILEQIKVEHFPLPEGI